MRATDYLKYAKTNLNEAMELYNSDEKEKQHQAIRQFETTVKFARQGKKHIQEYCITLKKEEIIVKLDEIISICDQHCTKKGCKKLAKANQTK